MTGNYAWYYIDRIGDVCYWCYSNEMSCTSFADVVSRETGKNISVSDTSHTTNRADLERHQGYASRSVHV